MNSNLWATIQWALGSMDEAQAIVSEAVSMKGMATYTEMAVPAHRIIDLAAPVADSFPDLGGVTISAMSEPEVGALEARAVAAGFDWTKLKDLGERLMVIMPALIAFLKGLKG